MTETDGQPMHLCPVDLRKVLHATRSRPVDRYRALAAFYKRHGLEQERAFVALRLEVIEHPSEPPMGNETRRGFNRSSDRLEKEFDRLGG